MKRAKKNILSIILTLLLATSIGFTIYQIKSQQTPPTAPNGQVQQQTNNSSDHSDSSNNSKNNFESNDIIKSSNQQTPPEKPSSKSDSNSDSHAFKQGRPAKFATRIATKYIVLLGAETFFFMLSLLYLIFSRFHKTTWKETFSSWKKFTIYGLTSILLTCGLTFGETYIVKQLTTPTKMQQPNNNSQPDNGGNGEPGSSNNDNVNASSKATATKTISTSKKTLSGNYTSKKSDQSVALVKNGGTLTLNNAVLNKISGDSSNTENSEFYGINAGLLVTTKSTANITNTKISTAAKGSNAVFATGTNATINISDSTITTSGSSSARGLDATYGGTINADNVTVSTSGNSCASLATDRGEGTVSAKNSTLSTKGTGSPVIYSTGKISISNTTGTASDSQMVVIEGKNSATVTNSKLTTNGHGNRNNIDNSGIMIYQSMSGDASTGTGTFTAKNSTLSVTKNSSYYKTAPMFFVTNTDAVINLTNSKLAYGSNTLLSIKGTSEWGQSGSNGGTVKLNASKQTLSGNISLDKLSTLTMKLSNSSTYTGTINAKNTAEKISLTLDSSSKIKLTGDSYVTSFSDEDASYSNIDFNGHTLYVNGKALKQ